MSKILAISDIHIHDYAQRNPQEKYRLYQTRTVTQNILEVAKKNGADILVIAGDVLEKYLVRPYIQAEVKLFLESLMSYFKEGYIIWGNHDQDNKGNNSEFNDSCLSVMLPSNLHYADMKEITIDGTRIGFYNWRPEFDLSWINGKLDILFTHATISYQDDDRYQSQVLDESKFDLAFCGDIHRPTKKGKYVSIGIPQKAKMGDSDYSTGVILDCANHHWEWVNLNPHDNLMKFEYTENKDEEGWDAKNGIWKVYKPKEQVIQGGVRTIQIPAWDTTDQLINQSIQQSGLDQVHAEVLRNIPDLDAKEVDFDFTVTRLYCKNWRSIEESELYFNQYDKVKIVGANGSGKSSILSALKYAFISNRSYKDLVQFGSKDCRVEVDFIYQGNKYRLTRGSKRNGLEINGVAQKYNNKNDFDTDVSQRFPFISYIQDTMFIDSDHPRFIGSITPDRKSEIIARFYKLDRLDTFNGKAKELMESYKQSGQTWKEESERTAELLKYINDKLSLLVPPSLTENELLIKRAEGKEIQRKWQEYNSFVERSSSLMGRKEVLEKRIQELNLQVQGLRDLNLIQEQVKELQSKEDWIRGMYANLLEIKTEGKRAYFDRKDLETAKVCATCGHPITVENLQEHKSELDKKIQRLVEKQNEIYTIFRNHGFQDKGDIDSGCQGTLGQISQEKAALYSEIQTAQRLVGELEGTKNQLQITIDTLSSLGPIPEKVDLPEHFMEQMGQIEADLSIWNQCKTLNKDKSDAETKIVECQKNLSDLSSIVGMFQSYIELTGTTGIIYQKILDKLATQFSDNNVIYKAGMKTRGAKKYLDLDSYFRLDNNEVAYQNCSDGQKTVLDIDFMSKILTKVGFLVLDEALKYLDPQNLEEVLDKISQMDINLVLLSSHVESLGKFNNKTLNLALDENKITKIQMV